MAATRHQPDRPLALERPRRRSPPSAHLPPPVAGGVEAFFYEPAKGLVESPDAITGLAEGIYLGTRSLAGAGRMA